MLPANGNMVTSSQRLGGSGSGLVGENPLGVKGLIIVKFGRLCDYRRSACTTPTACDIMVRERLTYLQGALSRRQGELLATTAIIIFAISPLLVERLLPPALAHRGGSPTKSGGSSGGGGGGDRYARHDDLLQRRRQQKHSRTSGRASYEVEGGDVCGRSRGAWC